MKEKRVIKKWISKMFKRIRKKKEKYGKKSMAEIARIYELDERAKNYKMGDKCIASLTRVYKK